jgi:VWFA-related protein
MADLLRVNAEEFQEPLEKLATTLVQTLMRFEFIGGRPISYNFRMKCLAIVSLIAIARAQSQEPSFHTRTDLVNVVVTVRDQHNNLITNLDKSSLRVFEDGRSRDIKYFAQDSSAPLTIGLLIDSSAGQGFLLRTVRDAAMQFLSTTVREKDLAFLINFDTEVTLLTDLTNNQAALKRGLQQMRSGVGYPIGPLAELNLSRTHLYDAIYLAAEKLKDEAGHKAIIMIASGDDKGSKVKLDEAMVAAEKADAAVYAIRYVDADLSGTSYASLTQQTIMRNISHGTGGRTLNPGRSDALTKAVRDIAEELRGQYSIGFTPAKLDGSVHKIEVRVGQRGLRAQCRKTYFAEARP